MSAAKTYSMGEDVPFGSPSPMPNLNPNAPEPIFNGRGGVTIPTGIPDPVNVGPNVPVPPQPGDSLRPAWLPAKFKSAEDMAAAYGELERRQSAPKPAVTPEAAKAPETPAAAPDGTKPPEAAKDAAVDPKAAQTKPTPFATLEAEVAKGELTEETRGALKAAGLPEALIDSTLTSMRFAAEAITGLAHTTFGGAENFAAAQQRAAAELSEPERALFNNLIHSGSYTKAQEGLQWLQERLGGFVSPGLGAARGEFDDGYRSYAEMRAAQDDPRYAKDTHFTNEFERKSILMHDRMQRQARRR